MTVEEAGQIILEGHPFCKCPTCYGFMEVKIGVIQSKDVNKPDRNQYGDCSVCKGTGKIVNPAYAEACKALDMPLPVPRRSVTDVQILSNRPRKSDYR